MLLIKDISQYWTYAIVHDSWTLLQNKLFYQLFLCINSSVERSVCEWQQTHLHSVSWSSLYPRHTELWRRPFNLPASPSQWNQTHMVPPQRMFSSQTFIVRTTCWSYYYCYDDGLLTLQPSRISILPYVLCFTCDDGFEEQSLLFESHPSSRYEGQLKHLLFPEADRTAAKRTFMSVGCQ